jgi:hypothetical protein
MKLQRPRLLVVSISIFILMILFVHLYWLDGVGGAVLEMLIGNTEYSESYHEYKFRQLRKGMTGKDVKAVIGKPLRTIRTKDIGEEIWFFTSPKILDKEGIGANCDYTERYVFLFDDTVTAIHHSFYFD